MLGELKIKYFPTGKPRFARTQSNMNQARILQKHSPTKSHLRDKTDKKLISRDFLPGDRRQQLFDRPTFATTLGPLQFKTASQMASANNCLSEKMLRSAWL